MVIIGKNYFQFFTNCWNLAQMFALGVIARLHFLPTVSVSSPWLNMPIMATHTVVGKNLPSRTTSSVAWPIDHELWHRCLPLGVDVQDTFLDSGRKCMHMVTALWQKLGEILRRTTSSVFQNSHKIWHRCLPLDVDVQDTIFHQW